MLIKSISRKDTNNTGASRFRALYNYLHKKADEQCQTINYNFKQQQDPIEQLQDNYKHARKIKNGVMFYHEVLSFNAEDKELSQDDLVYFAEQWLDLRAPKNLAYGIVHTHQNNLHVHLIISSNEIGRSKKHRLTKKQFKEAQLRLEQIQRERCPHLTHSICQEPIRQKRKPQKEHNRNKPTESRSIKDTLKLIIEEAIQQPNFEQYLKSKGIKIYKRGKNNGIIYEDKRYRFGTLGFEPKLDEAQDKKLVRENEAEKKKEQTLQTFRALRERDEQERKRDKDYER